MLTVVTAANSFRLATVAQLKADLNISGSAQDAALGEVLDQASAAIATWCNRVFAIEAVTEIIDPRAASEAIIVERYPVIAITAMTLAGVAVTLADIERDKAAGLLYRLDGNTPAERIEWDCGRVVVSYSGGYLLPGEVPGTDDDPAETLPADLTRAALTLATRVWMAKGRDPAVKGVGYSDNSRIDYGTMGSAGGADGMPADIVGMIARHRRPVL